MTDPTSPTTEWTRVPVERAELKTERGTITLDPFSVWVERRPTNVVDGDVTNVRDEIVYEHTTCATPGCHNLLSRPSAIPRVCTAPCNLMWLAEEFGAAMSRSFQEAARVLTPAVAAMADAFKRAAQHIGPLFRFVRVRPKRTGPPPLCIDGHAYRNRTRRRTRKNRR